MVFQIDVKLYPDGPGMAARRQVGQSQVLGHSGSEVTLAAHLKFR